INPASDAQKRARTHGTPGNPAKAGVRTPEARAVEPASTADWIAGARLRTLPLAIAPVALGTGAGVVAIADGPWHPARAVLALVVGLALTIVTGQWWLLAVGAVAIVAAWFYTGGRHPYGYYGLGELFVFVFFGLVATAGSAFVQALTVNLEAWLSGAGAGLLACAVLMANNLRDVAQDKVSGKRTLAVLVGPLAGRILFVVFMLVPFAIAGFWAFLYPTAWLVQFALLAALPACLIVLTAKTPREFITALQLASLTALVYGVGLGLVFAL